MGTVSNCGGGIILSDAMLPPKSDQLVREVLDFVNKSAGLSFEDSSSGAERKLAITQACDGKKFEFSAQEIIEVLQRTDSDGKVFIQVNFSSGNKVLFTDSLVGFKPSQTMGLDMTKIPRVVTTPDLLSVFEAIEDCLSSESLNEYELDILKKVFVAILNGAESVGFELTTERKWYSRITPLRAKISA